MSVATSIPQKPSARNVELIASPENDNELWVIPAPELGLVDLPRLRHLLPVEFASAPVVDFQPLAGSNGAWILSKTV
jgi:hypothetical protein